MLHGNVVRAIGDRARGAPVVARDMPCSPPRRRSPAAVAAPGCPGAIGVGEGDRFPAVEVGDDLAIRRATWRAARVADRRWLLLAADRGASVTVTLDDDGAPAGLEDAAGWPLEVDLPA